MRPTQFVTAATIALLLAGSAIAQSNDDTSSGTTVPEQAPVAPETTPSADAPVPTAQPQIEVVTTTHGDWELRCTADKSDCFMYQLLQDAANNPVAEFTLLALPKGGQATAGATVVTPLGTLLEPGLVLQVDSGQARKYNYTWCDQSGCFARFGLEAAQTDSYKRGNVARMRIVSASNPQQPVDLTVSLSGFTAAFNEMTAALDASTTTPVPAAPASE